MEDPRKPRHRSHRLRSRPTCGGPLRVPLSSDLAWTDDYRDGESTSAVSQIRTAAQRLSGYSLLKWGCLPHILTTSQLRPKYPSDSGRPVNPYAYNRRIDTIVATLCRPMDLHSALDARGLVEKDVRQDNPGTSQQT